MSEPDDPTPGRPDAGDPFDPGGDPLLAGLADLPAPDVDDLRARRIRELAHAALARGTGRRGRFDQVAIAAQALVLVGASAAYVGWAFHAVLAFYH
jgi:hypothetical protein